MGIDPMEHKWRVDTEVILEIYGPWTVQVPLVCLTQLQ